MKKDTVMFNLIVKFFDKYLIINNLRNIQEKESIKRIKKLIEVLNACD